LLGFLGCALVACTGHPWPEVHPHLCSSLQCVDPIAALITPCEDVMSCTAPSPSPFACLSTPQPVCAGWLWLWLSPEPWQSVRYWLKRVLCACFCLAACMLASYLSCARCSAGHFRPGKPPIPEFKWPHAPLHAPPAFAMPCWLGTGASGEQLPF